MIPALYHNNVKVDGCNLLVFAGSGHQYNNTSMVLGYVILALYNPTNRKQWRCGESISYSIQNDEKTRGVRCVKIPVDFIY